MLSPKTSPSCPSEGGAEFGAAPQLGAGWAAHQGDTTAALPLPVCRRCSFLPPIQGREKGPAQGIFLIKVRVKPSPTRWG